MTAATAEKILARALADLASLPPPAPPLQATAPAAEPLLATVEEAALALGVGRTRVFALIASGALRSKKIGRSRRIPYDALAEYVESLPDEPPPQ